MGECLRKYLPCFEPTLAAAALSLIGYAVLFIGRYPYEAGAPMLYFCFYVPWLIFTLARLVLSYVLGQPRDDAYLYGILPMSAFLVLAGAWIYHSEHDWQDAVYVPFTAVMVIGNLIVVCWAARVIFVRWRRR
jgi:hypothetical protein